MKLLKQDGFTIVETMLFLAISGVLAVSILVGTGVAINIQRYRDSVTSLQSFLQQQYSEVANVNNDTSGNACAGDQVPRGQSNCVILGKYITSQDDKMVSVKTVTGTETTVDTGANDIDTLKSYNIKVSSMGSETYEVAWGASMDSKSGSPMTPPAGFSVLILRSPASGLIRTFIDGSHAIADSEVQSLLLATPSALNSDATICVNSNGLFTGTKMAVYIQKNTTGSSGIILLGDNSGCN